MSHKNYLLRNKRFYGINQNKTFQSPCIIEYKQVTAISKASMFLYGFRMIALRIFLKLCQI